MKAVYGIDLGTMKSCIAAVNEETGKPEVKPNREGGLTTPSVVYFEKGKPEPVVGRDAKRWARVAPSLVCSEVKRHMGAEDWRFRPRDKEFRAETISAYILRKLIEDALKHDKAEFDGEVPVVISIPVYFGDAERSATRVAARAADLDIRYLIPDPVAAVFAHGLQSAGQGHILVCDIGATAQATVISAGTGRVKAIAACSETAFGGLDWDRALVTHFCRAIRQEAGIELRPASDPELEQQLYDQAENAKIGLCSADNATMEIRVSDRRHSSTISRAEFERMTAKLVKRGLKIAREAAAKAEGCGVRRPDKLLLAGGMSLVPFVRTRFEEEFGLEAIPDASQLSVAHGAALIADLIRRGKDPAAEIDFDSFQSGALPHTQEDARMPVKKCCGAVLPPDSRFCPRCGRALAKCPACGRDLEPDSRFCQYCGARQDAGDAAAGGPAEAPPAPVRTSRREGRASRPAARQSDDDLARRSKQAEDLLRREAGQREREQEERRRKAAEIRPGTWRQVPIGGAGGGGLGGLPGSMLRAMKGEFVWRFEADGTLSGQLRVTGGMPPAFGGMLMQDAVQMQLDINGTWSYDYRTRVLLLEGGAVMQALAGGMPLPAMPAGEMSRQYRITGGSSDDWEAVAVDDGSKHRFIRTL